MDWRGKALHEHMLTVEASVMRAGILHGKQCRVSHGTGVAVHLLSNQQEATMPYDIMTAACVLRAVRA